MQYQNEKESKPIIQGKKTLDAAEMNRLLKRHQGIFKNDIKGFANSNIRKVMSVKNYAR